MMLEPEIKRWTVRHQAELTRQLYKEETTIEEASCECGLTPSEIERWIDNAEARIENALKANPKDVAEQNEQHLSGLTEVFSPAMLKVKSLKKLQRHINEALAARNKRGIDTLPYIGYQTVAWLLGENKNTVQRAFPLKNWQVHRRRSEHRPRVQSLRFAASRASERLATKTLGN